MTDTTPGLPLPDREPSALAQWELDHDPLVQFMRQHGIPVTRHYLDLSYPGDELPDPWTRGGRGDVADRVPDMKDAGVLVWNNVPASAARSA